MGEVRAVALTKQRIGGMRDTVRPGHHAAAVAAPMASSIAATTNTHGRCRASMRYPTALPTLGATAIQPTNPIAVPTTAAIAPVAAPVISIVRRSCFSFAPTAAIIPS